MIQVYGLDLCSFPRAPLHYVRQTALELSRQAIERKVIVDMPGQRRTELLFQGAAFGPRATRVMGEAYERVCQSLNDVGQPSIVKEIIARRIVEAAKSGERDPESYAGLR